jgi:enamine deaminase RidA (YjgF/YER057c/UK114 family)
LATEGRVLHVAGLTGHHEDGTIDPSLAVQFGTACSALSRVIDEAGGEPGDLVSLMIYTTVVDQYRNSLPELGRAYRAAFGKHYPPMALLGVSELFDERAMVELVGVAVVPDG